MASGWTVENTNPQIECKTTACLRDEILPSGTHSN